MHGGRREHLPNQRPAKGLTQPTESDNSDSGTKGPTTPTIHQVEVSETISITVLSTAWLTPVRATTPSSSALRA